MKVYGVPDSAHFGDVWLFVSGAIIQSLANKEIIYLSKYAEKDFDKKKSYEKEILLCLQHLETYDSKIQLVEDLDNQAKKPDWASSKDFEKDIPQPNKSFIPYWVGACKNPPVPTKIKHSKISAEKNLISLQISSYLFDSKKNVYTSMKPNWYQEHRYIPCWELEKIYLNFLSSTNLKINVVGEHIGLAKSIEIMSKSQIFIGIDSGMSHVASSVGVPVYLYFWKKDDSFDVFRTHTRKGINTFNNFDDLYKILEIHNIKI